MVSSIVANISCLIKRLRKRDSAFNFEILEGVDLFVYIDIVLYFFVVDARPFKLVLVLSLVLFEVLVEYVKPKQEAPPFALVDDPFIRHHADVVVLQHLQQSFRFIFIVNKWVR